MSRDLSIHIVSLWILLYWVHSTNVLQLFPLVVRFWRRSAGCLLRVIKSKVRLSVRLSEPHYHVRFKMNKIEKEFEK